MNSLYAIAHIDAADLPVPRFPVEPSADAGGQPSVGSADVFSIGSSRVGVWELGVGAMFDVETDEVFVVLHGEASVEILDGSGLVAERIELRPGVMCRLREGTRTRWIVTRTLRKVYVLPAAAD